jgi:beta-lactamase regulating signal transducer with metallopeptidase domain
MMRSLASLLAAPSVLGLLMKVTLVLLLGAGAAALLRRASAAARHFVWMLALTGSVALTLTAPIAPGVPVRIAAWTAPASTVGAGEVDRAPAEAGRALPVDLVSSAGAARVTETPAARASAAPLDPAALLRALYLLGVLAVAGWCAVGHWGLARLLGKAEPLTAPEWQGLLGELTLRSGLKAPPRLFRSSAVGSPVTWGIRPVVVLPDDAEAWPAERRRVVLAHELAHVARGDYLAQLAASVTCAVYWFHPLAWVAARRLRSESERAADDLVLARGTPGHEYASHLLDVARRSQLLRPGGMVAIGMARPSHLEGRLLAVLDQARARQALKSRARAAGWGGLALLVLPLVLLRPAPAPAAVLVLNREPVAVAPEPPRPEQSVPVVNVQREQADSELEKSVEASPGGELLLDLESGGSVDIRAWDEPRVAVRARLAGRSWRDTRVSLERTERGAVLHAWQEEERRSSSTSHHFEIQVPRKFDVRVRSAGGDVTIVGVDGRFSGHTGGGAITIEKANGEATISTGGGTIKVSDSDLRGSVSTGGGMITLSRVRGPLSGRSGSGPVIYTEGTRVGVDRETGGLERVTVSTRDKVIHIDPGERHEGRDGRLHITKAGGDIVLDRAPDGAVLSTGGGDVRVGRSSGDVTVNTGGGDIEVGPATGSVSAETGAGDVTITIVGGEAKGADHSVEVSSGQGRVVIELPENLSARFDLETAYTNHFGRKPRIISDWNLRQEETDRWDDSEGTPRKYVRARGTVGEGGGLIRVRIVNGDVTIRRGRR